MQMYLINEFYEARDKISISLDQGVIYIKNLKNKCFALLS